MREDAERWDARYTGRQPGQPSPPDGLDGVALPDGGVCVDVACGLGEQSLWAAGLGFDVVALDVSDVAVDALRRRADELGLAERIDARHVDLDDGLPPELDGRCALVICQRFRDRRLYPGLVAALAPGGVLVVTVLSEVGADAPGAFHAPPGELVDALRAEPLQIVRHVEADGAATLVARRR